MTLTEIATLFAADRGITVQQARNLMKNKSKDYVEWMAQHPDYTVDGRGSRGMIDVASAGAGIDEMLTIQWANVQSMQSLIEDILDTREDIHNLKSLVSAQKDAQQAYLQLSEIKKRDEDRKAQVIKREAVEGILNKTFPKLKQATQNQNISIKQILPPEMRAAYESAYQQSLGAYGDAVQSAVDELNDLLD